jgi:IMP dehydrogenase
MFFKMVKKIKGNWKAEGRSFEQFTLLPGHTSKDCTMHDVNLESYLAGIHLRLPLMSAAMTSVTGYEMALALGKEGGIGILPARLSVEEQANIVRRIKGYETGFVDDPIVARPNMTVEKVLRLVEDRGHTTIPVVDRFYHFLGMFTQDNYLKSSASLEDNVMDVMIHFDGDDRVPFVREPDIAFEKAKGLMGKEKYLVVLDDQNRLVKLAFKKDIEMLKVGAAISTHEGWKERVMENVDAGVDMIVIDTSDAHNDFVADVLGEYKSNGLRVPVCVGNIVTYKGAMFLMENGADIVKVGMSSGSICTTAREKAVGRAQMTAVMDAVNARDKYFEKHERYVPIVSDGGIKGSADMLIALTMADVLMMGGYFNQFKEAAGEKLDRTRNLTNETERIAHVATWGEGSRRAQNLARYGQVPKTFFEEGAEGIVDYAGRLKPNLKTDMMKIRSAISNAGCYDLEDLRDNAVIELISSYSANVVKDVHGIIKK